MREILATALVLAALAGTWRAAALPSTGTPPAAVTTEPMLFAEGVVSTPDDEFGAAFTPDEKTVYFTKRTPTTNTPPLSYVCVARLAGGRWQEPEIASFSGEYNDMGVSVSPDGRRLFFASDRPLPGASASADRDLNIWVVDLGGSSTAPRPLGSNVNTPAEDLSPSVAADGTLYFASTRPGGRGSLDLWRAAPDGDDFGPAENLGEVNSPGPDGAPAIAPDQSFLVFASSGRPDTIRGAGHYYPRSDIYVSFRCGAGFGAPRHLEPPVNTPASESNPSLSPDGLHLYFSSDRGFASIPMDPAATAESFTAALSGVRSGWSNVYRIDAGVLGRDRR
jgi:Tol biopolymer transport system component